MALLAPTRFSISKKISCLMAGELMLPNRNIVIIVIVSAVALGGGVTTYAIGIPNSPCYGVAGATRNFAIIASSNGFNDSVDHPGQTWPLFHVNRCDTVKITIINTDTQAHGFAIAYYGIRGTEIPGQQTQSFPPFLASKSGQFVVYCIIRCTVHWAMLNGLMVVE